jgi:hypothetical protein
MKRSGDVTAAAIVLFFGCGLLLFLAAILPLTLRSAPQPQPPFPLAGMPVSVAVLYLLMAAWGVLKRSSRGRVLMIVTGALVAALLRRNSQRRCRHQKRPSLPGALRHLDAARLCLREIVGEGL